MNIESHDDNSVTLTAGSITARISGDGWRDANRAAHALGAIIEATYDVNALVRKLDGLRQQVQRVASTLDAVDFETKSLFDWLDIPTQPSSTGEKP